jgi:hypothetical protein
MTTATAKAAWNDEVGFWQVTDEYGNVWDVVSTSDQSMLLVREDSQRYYGAVWIGSDGFGEMHPSADGDVRDGFDCNDRYTFDSMSGWVGEQE